MVGEACLPSNAYFPRTPDYTLYSGVRVCWSEHSDSTFVYGFMSLDYGLGTMTATTLYRTFTDMSIYSHTHTHTHTHTRYIYMHWTVCNNFRLSRILHSNDILWMILKKFFNNLSTPFQSFRDDKTVII